jgi:hypothetical protein
MLSEIGISTLRCPSRDFGQRMWHIRARMPAPEETTPPRPKPPDSAMAVTEHSEVQPALTPEEQMEQFEESLKEDDWGHQPC